MEQLVIGRWYVRRDGEKIGPLEATPEDYPLVDSYPFRDPTFNTTYNSFGFMYSEDRTDPKDLVELIKEHLIPDVVPTVEAGIWA